MGIAWNTVHRWLERAANACRRFNENRIEAIEIVELQADEIRSFVVGKGLLYGFLQHSKFALAAGLRLSLEIAVKTMRWSCCRA